VQWCGRLRGGWGGSALPLDFDKWAAAADGRPAGSGFKVVKVPLLVSKNVGRTVPDKPPFPKEPHREKAIPSHAALSKPPLPCFILEAW